MESEDILHAMLKTQISSIKGLEIAEEKNKSVENIEMVTRRKGTSTSVCRQNSTTTANAPSRKRLNSSRTVAKRH